MKVRNILLGIIGILTIVACKETIPEAEIPSVVLNTMKIEFNNATNVSWEKKGSIYEAEFEIENLNHDVMIEETGKLIKYKKEVLLQDLPETLRDSLIANYIDIDDVDLLQVGEKTYFQVEIDGRLTGSKKVFNNLGEEIRDIRYYDEI